MRQPKHQADMNFAMRVSFAIGIVILFIKLYAYFITGSTAVLSDAAESIIHIFAVGFATYSMWLSMKPADSNHLYGHDKVSFLSAGFEGGLILLASIYIIYESIKKILYGMELESLDAGVFFVVLAVIINSILSVYLIKKGKQYKSIILEADGKHILTDCYTSIGAIIALVLVKLTGISLFDPVIAILTALNILWTGFRLIKKSIGGLMDQTDPELHNKIRDIIKAETERKGVSYHYLRHRSSGHKIFIEFHLLFSHDLTLRKAHDIASEIESRIKEALESDVEIFTHLEPQKQHDETHRKYGLKI